MKSESGEPSGRGAQEESGASEPEHTVLDWPRRIGGLDYFRGAVASRLRRRRRRRQAACGGLAALTIAGAAWLTTSTWSGNAPHPLPASPVVSWPVRQTLPDGSVVELRAGARIAIDFGEAFRRVTLTSGEAHFQVAKNPARPFVVSAGGVDVRAVGTAFDVDLSTGKIEVLVTEGRVAVERPALPVGSAPEQTTIARPSPLAVVDAGHRVEVPVAGAGGRGLESAPVVLPVSAIELNGLLAWRARRLEFSGTPLSEAIALINQYGSVHLVLGDSELGRVELSGVLRVDHIDALLRMLNANYAIRAEHRDDGTIVLRKAP